MRGGKFVMKRFAGLGDVMKLQEEIVFNCMGARSKEVFSDDMLEARVGV